jgi:hypothetical protein
MTRFKVARTAVACALAILSVASARAGEWPGD